MTANPPRELIEEAPEAVSGSASGGRRALMVRTLVIIVLLALLGGLLWRGGAFGRRTDRAIPVAPGTTVTAGPFELTFTKVTVQKASDAFTDKVIWKVRALGSGRVTGDESLAPSTLTGGMFVSRDDQTRQIQEPSGARWGAEERIGDGSAFTPGLAPIPYVVEFTYPESYRPSASLAFGVFDQEFTDPSLLQDQDKSWNNADRYFLYPLPIERLPDDLK